MGEHYSQQAPRTGYRRATAYTPPYADYNGYHPEISYGHTSSGRGPDVTEIMTLRSRISVLERQLVERHREIGDARRETGEARAAIAYLLKLNASATSSHGSVSGCRPENHPSNGQAAIVMEQVKDLLSTMISLVHKQLSIAVNNNHRSGHLPRAKDKSGDSALHDQCPTIETRNAGKKTWPQQGDCNVPEALPGLQSEKPSEHGETQDIPEPTPTAPEKGETSKSDDFPLLPYVTRFTQAEGQAPQLASDRHNDKAPPEHGKEPESLQTSFKASGLDLSGSTQYDSSESTGLTSLNSSFHSSGDETFPRPGNEHRSKVEAVEEEPGVTSWTIPSHGASATGASESLETVAVTAPSSHAPQQASDTAALFVPKWPAKSIIVFAGERDGAIFIHKQVAGDQEHQFPDLFRYGIRFRPEPNETDIYRTVLVDNIPPNTRLFTLLQRVKGGPVLDAKFLDTISIKGSLSAMITFVHEHGAKAFVNGASRRPLVFDEIRARVILLPTPTYPMPKNLHMAITNHGHTRCLEIQNFPRGIKPAELERDLRIYQTMTAHRIESKRMRADGVLELRFTSIYYAGRAYGILNAWSRYRRCIISFASDPCAQPWEEVPEQPAVVRNRAEPSYNQSKVEVADVDLPGEVIFRKEHPASYGTEYGDPDMDLIDFGED